MFANTATRVENNSPDSINSKIQEKIQAQIARYAGASPLAIDRRLEKLDREINIERAIELELQ